MKKTWEVMKFSLVKKQGLLGLRVNGGSAALVELNCETDFVARNQKFLALLEEVHIVHFSILPCLSSYPKYSFRCARRVSKLRGRGVKLFLENK